MHNSGSIVADKDVTLTGNSIHNDNGLIKGNTATVIANDEVLNTQGTIMGNDTVSVYAKKALLMKVVLSHKLMQLAPQRLLRGVM